MKIKEKLNFITKLSELFDKKEKRQFFFIMLAVLIMSLFQALGVASILPFISLVMDHEIIFRSEKLKWLFNFFHFQNTQSFIIALGFLMVAVIIIGNLVSAWAIYLKSRFVWRKSHDLSTSLLKKYLSLPYSFFLTSNTADLGKNILVEVQMLTRGFLIPIFEIIIDLVLASLIVLVLLIMKPLVAVTIASALLFSYGSIYYFGLRRHLKNKGNRRRKENAARFKTVSEALGGIKDIKVLGREAFFCDKFETHSLEFSNLLAWQEISSQIPRYFIEIIAFGSVIIFILYLVFYNRNIQQTVPVISFLAFAGYRLMPVINRLFQAFAQLQFNRVVLDKLHHDLKRNMGRRGMEGSGPFRTRTLVFEKQINIKLLTFSYCAINNPVFEQLNLTIPKNSSVAIVGPTGTGKTTFVDILLGLLQPTKGEIEVDGVNITEENLREWQNTVGYVPQFIFLSDDTIKRNIAFGLPDEKIEQDKVEKAAAIANLHDFVVKTLPSGYDTLVGERGIRLSGGQRQRVGIARALYNDPAVLVLDEATSSLDGVTEEVVLNEIENISKLKTIIIIAHRLTTVKQCDTIYLLDKGRITAEGTYDALIKNCSQFRAMARDASSASPEKLSKQERSSAGG